MVEQSAGGERASGGGRGTFTAHLEAHPETREVLQQRMKAYPEYEVWLRQYGTGVLTGLGVPRK